MTKPQSHIATASENQGIESTHNELLPCPFCGAIPAVYPLAEWGTLYGNAFGTVACKNPKCPAKPEVRDNVGVADERGLDAYRAAAIAVWNTRSGSPQLPSPLPEKEIV